MSSIKVIKPGFFTTVQDLGRYGFQKFGMPVAGVMDNYSYRIANLLVGNKETEAVLEVNFLGPEIEFTSDMSVAITGANMMPKLNGKEVPMWRSLEVHSGDIISLGAIQSGIRSYISFSGEFDIELVNNSKSTYTKTGIGGFKGRKLEKDDEIKINVSDSISTKRFLDARYIPKYNNKNIIRVVLGPQEDYFTEEGINSFLNPKGYKITKQADRMGYRLEGEKIQHKDKADIISDGALFGSVQVPSDGQPIILMADKQTTGGYTKIATVISADLPIISQMGTGSEIIFKSISLEEAQKSYIEYENNILAIKSQIASTQSPYTDNDSTHIYIDTDNSSTMKLLINGKKFTVKVEEIE